MDWIKEGGSVDAVVQQFDEQAILQCATFSQDRTITCAPSPN